VNDGAANTLVSFSVDEGSAFWVERGGDINEGSGTQIYPKTSISDTNLDFYIDPEDLNEGMNNIYIFVEDADGNVGRRGFMLEKNIPPDVPNFHLGFGDETIYVTIEALDADDIEYYRVYYSQSRSDLTVDPPTSNYMDVYNFTPGSEKRYEITGVTNNATYYVRVRAHDESGNYGALSPIKSVTPQETESLVERTGESGGCTVASPGDNAGLAGELALLCIWMAGIIALRAGFGHKGGGR